YESLDPETTPPDYEIIPPEPRVARRTAHAVYDKCATYFLQIRDSLRNIKLDIEKVKEQQSLYASDDFWRTFITKASKVKTAEPQLWDFKETLSVWHVKNDPERRKAKVAFAEDVARREHHLAHIFQRHLYAGPDRLYSVLLAFDYGLSQMPLVFLPLQIIPIP